MKIIQTVLTAGFLFVSGFAAGHDENEDSFTSDCGVFEICLEAVEDAIERAGKKRNAILSQVICQHETPETPLTESACRFAFETCMDTVIKKTSIRKVAESLKLYEERCSHFAITEIGLENCPGKMSYIRCPVNSPL